MFGRKSRLFCFDFERRDGIVAFVCDPNIDGIAECARRNAFGIDFCHIFVSFADAVADDIAPAMPESSDGIDDLGGNDADAQNSGAAAKHPRCGTILAGAAKNAAQNLLNIIAKGTRP